MRFRRISASRSSSASGNAPQAPLPPGRIRGNDCSGGWTPGSSRRPTRRRVVTCGRIGKSDDAARPLVHDPELRQRSPCIGEAIPGPRPGARRPGVGREGLLRAGRRRARRRHSRLGRQGVVRLHSSHLRHPRHGGARPELGPGAAALRPGRDSPGGGLRRTGSGGRCTGRRAGRARRQGEAVRLARTGRHRATGIGRGGGGLDSGRELVALPEAVIRHAAVRRVRVGPLDLLPRRRRSVDPG